MDLDGPDGFIAELMQSQQGLQKHDSPAQHSHEPADLATDVSSRNTFEEFICPSVGTQQQPDGEEEDQNFDFLIEESVSPNELQQQHQDSDVQNDEQDFDFLLQDVSPDPDDGNDDPALASFFSAFRTRVSKRAKPETRGRKAGCAAYKEVIARIPSPPELVDHDEPGTIE